LNSPAYEVPSPALAEWEKILESPFDNIMALLVDRSENAIRIRQSSPFAGVLPKGWEYRGGERTR